MYGNLVIDTNKYQLPTKSKCYSKRHRFCSLKNQLSTKKSFHTVIKQDITYIFNTYNSFNDLVEKESFNGILPDGQYYILTDTVLWNQVFPNLGVDSNKIRLMFLTRLYIVYKNKKQQHSFNINERIETLKELVDKYSKKLYRKGVTDFLIQSIEPYVII